MPSAAPAAPTLEERIAELLAELRPVEEAAATFGTIVEEQRRQIEALMADATDDAAVERAEELRHALAANQRRVEALRAQAQRQATEAGLHELEAQLVEETEANRQAAEARAAEDRVQAMVSEILDLCSQLASIVRLPQQIEARIRQLYTEIDRAPGAHHLPPGFHRLLGNALDGVAPTTFEEAK